ncbi:hypothetical protein ACVDG8_014495 [Mesorhizobium sp. ORM8.1]
MYDKSDPRASLAPANAKSVEFATYHPSEYARFYEGPPQLSDALVRTWLVRGQNAVNAYSETKAGAQFERKGQVDEWVLLLPDPNVVAELVVGGRSHSLSGGTVTFVPPGDSSLTIVSGGRVVRFFTTLSLDLAELCVNARSYLEADPNIPPFQPWPTPADGFKVRSYSLDVADEPGRFGRIWRCTTFMVNYLAPIDGPRDITKLSPHHHDDFEQYSLALQGAFIHHMRWPWTPNMKMWRPDEGEFCGTPSVAVIPPPAIHTTRAVDSGVNQLVDVFSPPRIDFSQKPGWVLNASDYPLP